MNRNNHPGHVPGQSRHLIVILLAFAGVFILVSVLVFAISYGIYQQSHQQADASPTSGPGTPVNGGHALIPGTVSPSQTGPYGFTILKHITPKTIAYLKELHVNWVRFQLDWSKIEPQSGQFDWSELDSAVSLLNASGIHIDFPLQLAPDWAKSQTCGGHPLLAGATEMAQYASALAQRYNGHNGHGYIDSYEIGNEEFDDHLPPIKKIIDKYCPGINLLPIAGPDLKAGYIAIKSQSPQALVGMFAIWWTNTQHVQNYIQYLYQNGYGPYFDYANFHYYPCAGNPNTAAPGNPAITDGTRPSFDLEWQTLHEIMAQHGDSGKPVWVTETGWTISGVNQAQRCIVSPDQQAQFMTYLLTEAAKSHVVQQLFWYTIDMKDDGMSITQSDTKLPSFYTLQRFIQQQPFWN